jgi:enamine deaminase RidA (YjgF/YER057c/UK114 family)
MIRARSLVSANAFRQLWYSVFLLGLANAASAQTAEITRSNPPGLRQSPTYSQVVTVTGPHKEIFLGGKAGFRPDGTLSNDIGEQARQALENIRIALASVGATFENIVEAQVYIVDLHKVDPEPIYSLLRTAFPQGQKPTLVVLGVTALALPPIKVEINIRAAAPTNGN